MDVAVIAIARRRSTDWRRISLMLAALAIVMKVLIPPGFMTAASASGGFPLVLCTGHGPVTLDSPVPGHPAKQVPADKPSHDPPCVFAGHGVAAAAPSQLNVAPVEFVAYAEAPRVGRPSDLAPGRGLAAPPLPARGPPSLLI
jgi:hypothetical protein